MTEPRTEKEALYDKHISPLLAQIIALCKAHKINMAAQFSLGADLNHPEEKTLWCSTVLPVDEEDSRGHEHINELRSVMYRQASVVRTVSHKR